jgi:hypothetical protein
MWWGFPNEVSAATLATEISLGSSEQWTLKCSLRWTRPRSSKRIELTNSELSTCKVPLAHGNRRLFQCGVVTSTCTKVLALLYLALLKVLFAPIDLRTRFRPMFAAFNLSNLTQV